MEPYRRKSWWGGMWDRMVRSVKNEEIEHMTEVEAVVNSHPITLTHTSSEEQCATYYLYF